MAWTTPATWTSALVTVAQFNTQLRDNLLAIFPAGPSWSAVTYASGNFTASAGTWTVSSGDVSAFRYVEIGKTMHVSLNLQTTTIATTAPAELRVTVPNGRTIAGSCSGSFVYYANGTYGSGLWSATSGTYVSLFRDVPATVWPICTDLVYIYATMTFEIA